MSNEYNSVIRKPERNRYLCSGVPSGGGGFEGFNPPPNSEVPPKSYQTQPDCENC